MAGVSVGTVDRVIHGRKNISKSALEKVQKVLDEIQYVPNHYASALASNKTYHFAAILPMHEVDSYWARVEKGIEEGLHRYSDFNIQYEVFRYDPFDSNSFVEQAQLMLDSKPFAVVIGPIFNFNIMKVLVGDLEKMEVP